ncbi:hypothetical protein D3C73_1301830 [compost metagenome]
MSDCFFDLRVRATRAWALAVKPMTQASRLKVADIFVYTLNEAPSFKSRRVVCQSGKCGIVMFNDAAARCTAKVRKIVQAIGRDCWQSLRSFPGCRALCPTHSCRAARFYVAPWRSCRYPWRRPPGAYWPGPWPSKPTSRPCKARACRASCLPAPRNWWRSACSRAGPGSFRSC